MHRRTKVALVGAAVIVGLVLVVACTEVKATMVDRAEGTWHCTSSAADAPFDVQVDRNGAFRLRDSTSVGNQANSRVDGSWRLDGTRVAIDLHPGSPTGQIIRASGVSETATRLRIRSWLGGHGTSRVRYHDDTVTIRDDVGGSTTWTCRRTSSHDPSLPGPSRRPTVAPATTAPRPTAPTTTESPQVLEAVDGVWFRFLGPKRTDPDTGLDLPQVDITVLADGRAVSVGSRDIFASAADYTTFTLSRPALDHLLTTIDRSGVLDHHDGRRGTVDGSSLSFGDGMVVEPVPPSMSEKLSDLSWLGDGVSATTPWQPEEVAVKISRYDPTRKVQAFDETVQRWPLDGTVADLVGSRCLTGDDARKVFALMQHGVTNVRIRVDDGSGIPWQIGVEPVVPGQPDLGGACS